MPQRPDYTILDRVIAYKGNSRVEGEIVSMELEEDYSFSYGPPQGVVNVTIRIEHGSSIEVSDSNWTIERVAE